MSPDVLIIGNSEDYHAVALRWALGKAGLRTDIWDGVGQASGNGISLSCDENVDIRLPEPLPRQLQSVWYRRPVPYQLPENVAAESRTFLEMELREAFVGSCTLINEVARFVVGGIENRTVSSKALQLKIARQIGFTTPRTLISNRYDDIVAFASDKPRMAVKHFSPHYWMYLGDGGARYVQTSLVSDITRFNRKSIELAPCIYQEYVEKAFELRVTVIGERIFAAKIEDGAGGTFVDWRYETGRPNFRMTATELDASVQDLIHELVRRLGLSFGCLDFIVDPDGELYFLEINPNGQFLFLEDFVPELRLLEAMTSMLATGCTRYDMLGIDGLDLGSFDKTPECKVLDTAEKRLDRKTSFTTLVA